MSPLEKLFGKTAQLTVLEYLIKKRGEINYLSGMAEGTGLYHSSVARVLDYLLRNKENEKSRNKTNTEIADVSFLRRENRVRWYQLWPYIS